MMISLFTLARLKPILDQVLLGPESILDQGLTARVETGWLIFKNLQISDRRWLACKNLQVFLQKMVSL